MLQKRAIPSPKKNLSMRSGLACEQDLKSEIKFNILGRFTRQIKKTKNKKKTQKRTNQRVASFGMSLPFLKPS